MPIDERAAWEDVCQRRPGPFFYCVTTTGVYCRPTCPSRRPRRERVRFVASPEAAERAGFRACRRCRPREAARPEIALVDRACAAIDAALSEGRPVTLRAIGAAVGLSEGRLQRVFKRVLGVSPRAWAAERRLARFRVGLRDEARVSEAVYAAGYGSDSRAYEHVQERMGMTPGAYRARGEGVEIRFTVVASTLGRVLVAATDRGLCSVRFGVRDDALEAALRSEFPRAELRGSDRALAAWARAVVRAIDGRERLDALPLDVRATAFQRLVWEALRRIPIGETRAYREIAAAIGRPTATRAVARACAANPVAVAVPCHRVVPADGSLGGYRWGPARKRKLLAAEGANPANGRPSRRRKRSEVGEDPK